MGELTEVCSIHDLHQAVLARIFGLADDGWTCDDEKRRQRRKDASERMSRRAFEARWWTRRNRNSADQISWADWMAGAELREAENRRIQAQRCAEHRARRNEEKRRRDAEFAADQDWAAETAPIIDGTIAGEMTLRVAQDSSTLASWSEAMNNCIRTYSDKLGSDLLAAATDPQGRMVANLEITRRSGITHVLGRNNTRLDPGVFWSIAEALEDHGITVAERCWGRPREQAAVA